MDKEFLKQQFDKILLVTLVLAFSAMAYRAYHVGSQELAQFAIDSSKLFAGALLTLITGRIVQKVMEPPPPLPPIATPPVLPAPVMAPTSPEAPQIGVGN